MNQNVAPKLSACERCGEVLFKWRDYTPIPLILVALIFAKPTVLSLLGGFFVSLVGELFRLYSVAYIGTISRTRSYSNGKLIQSGPFSGLRNPLYLGNLIICVGIGLSTLNPLVLGLIVALFYAQYIPIVAWEERKLTNIFGPEYLAYQALVPQRWFPSLRCLVSAKFWQKPEDWAPAWKSEKRTLLAFTSMFLALFLKWFFVT